MEYRTEIHDYKKYGFDKTVLVVDIALLKEKVIWQL